MVAAMIARPVRSIIIVVLVVAVGGRGVAVDARRLEHAGERGIGVADAAGGGGDDGRATARRDPALRRLHATARRAPSAAAPARSRSRATCRTPRDWSSLRPRVATGRSSTSARSTSRGCACASAPTGTYEVSRRTKVTFVGIGRDDRRTLRPSRWRCRARSPRADLVGALLGGRPAGELPQHRARAERVERRGRVAARAVITPSPTPAARTRAAHRRHVVVAGAVAAAAMEHRHADRGHLRPDHPRPPGAGEHDARARSRRVERPPRAC